MAGSGAAEDGVHHQELSSPGAVGAQSLLLTKGTLLPGILIC